MKYVNMGDVNMLNMGDKFPTLQKFRMFMLTCYIILNVITCHIKRPHVFSIKKWGHIGAK